MFGEMEAKGAALGAKRDDHDGNRDIGDFGRYMAHKVKKLGDQFQAAVQKTDSEGQESKLFEGVSIFVNGFTTPPHQELRNLMLEYGGNFENYFAKSRVTHIICSNLPDSKVKNFRSFSKGLPVLKPEWLVDSIAAGKLLACERYQLQGIQQQQRKLSSFFGSDCSATLSGTTSMSAKVDSEMTSIEKAEQTVDSVQRIDALDTEELELDMHEMEEDQSDDSDVPVQGIHDDSHRHSGSTRSTLMDPNFVENYFKRSRLHFIGTWRNRYQQKHKMISKSDSDQLCVIHVDMDCFFVSVVTRKHPELAGKPVAVCHSDSSRGTAEISSANYEARSHGVKAGMFVRDAKACCPGLEIVPYDFEAYEQVAEAFYDILHRHSPVVQAVSCDEAYIDVSGMGDPGLIASAIRNEILDATKCTASAGISVNPLLARLATKKAKPNGKYEVHLDQAEEFMANLPVEELPGVGWSLREKLARKSILTCSDLKEVTKDALRQEFGLKTGEMLWNYARGIDHRKVQSAQDRKSIGAEVNWGVRFSCSEEAVRFLVSLCDEVSTRLKAAAVVGRTFTVKVKKRKAGAGEPEKFMGCGSCHNMSRSATLPCSTDQREVILKVARQLFSSLNIAVSEIRGVGLQVTKLETSNSCSGNVQGQKSLKAWFEHSPQKKGKDKDTSEQHTTAAIKDTIMKENQNLAGLPPASDLDYSVLRSLPPEVFAEINQAYNGKLHLPCVSQGEGTSSRVRGPDRTLETDENAILVPRASQLDISVLEELPTQLRQEIMDALPGRDVSEACGAEAPNSNRMWDGHPPAWVQHFQASGSKVLECIAVRYWELSCPKYLSRLLLALYCLPEDAYSDESDACVTECCELVRQYVGLMLLRDLEEVTTSARIMRRMAWKWPFWNAIQERVLGSVQDKILQEYGGYLML